MIPQLKAKLEEAKKKISSEGYGNARFEDAVSILMPVIEKLILQRNIWPISDYPNADKHIDRMNQEILKLLEGEK